MGDRLLPEFPSADGFCYLIYYIERTDQFMISCSHPQRSVCFNRGNKIITNGKGWWPTGLIGTIVNIIPLYEFMDGPMPIRPAIYVRLENSKDHTQGYLDIHEVDLAI